MGARRASCAIVRRCAMYGIELKVYTPFVNEGWLCSCVACTCEIDKVRSYTGVMLEYKGVLLCMDVWFAKF